MDWGYWIVQGNKITYGGTESEDHPNGRIFGELRSISFTDKRQPASFAAARPIPAKLFYSLSNMGKISRLRTSNVCQYAKQSR